MPRIRSIKPEFFQDEDLAALDPLDRLVFIGIWTQADKAGRLEDRSARLKVQILPYDKADMVEIIDRLVAARFLTRYSAQGRAYLAVRTFTKHQRPHHTEQESDIPAPTPCDNGETTVPARMEEGMEEEEGREGKGGGVAPSALAAPAALHPLAEAWNSVAEAEGLSKVTSCSTSRRRHAENRLKEADVETWTKAYTLIAHDPFCRGDNDRGWKADFDYALRPEKSGRWLDLARNGGPTSNVAVPLRSAVNGKMNLTEVARRLHERD